MRYLFSVAVVVLVACVSEDRGPVGGTGSLDAGSSGSSGGSSGSSGVDSSSSGSSSGSSGVDSGIRCGSLPASAVLRLAASSLPGADGDAVRTWTSASLPGHPPITAACAGATLRKSGSKTSLGFAGDGGCELADGAGTRVAEEDFAVFVVAEPLRGPTSGTYDTLLSKADGTRGLVLGAPFLLDATSPIPAGVELGFGVKNVGRSLPLDTTTHVFAASRIGAKLSLFIDGAGAGTNVAAAGNDDVPTALVVGNTPGRGEHGFQGRIYDVVVLRTQTEADVAAVDACLVQAYRP